MLQLKPLKHRLQRLTIWHSFGEDIDVMRGGSCLGQLGYQRRVDGVTLVGRVVHQNLIPHQEQTHALASQLQHNR